MASGAIPLYGYRSVLNAEEIVDWAREQGFSSVFPPDDMHVTTLFSRRAFSVELSYDIEKSRYPSPSTYDTVLNVDTARSVQMLGDKGAVVLMLYDQNLQAEWQMYRDLGASWDYPMYQPHVTLTYKGSPEYLSLVKPFAGPIVFGWTKYRDITDGAPDDFPEVDL